jgi:hypothetical protein
VRKKGPAHASPLPNPATASTLAATTGVSTGRARDQVCIGATRRPASGSAVRRALCRASSLVAGYHLAFEIGAACLVLGIVLALAVLRPLDARAATTAASVAADSAPPPGPARPFATTPEPLTERQAASWASGGEWLARPLRGARGAEPYARWSCG